DTGDDDDEETAVSDCLPDPSCTPCGSDAYESNNTCQVATDMGSGLFMGDGSVTICPSCDEDWFERTIAADSTYALLLSFDRSEGDLRAQLYDSQVPPNLLAESVADGVGGAALVHTATATETLRLRVFIPPEQDLNGDAGNAYSIVVADTEIALP
ncbi:MAG TPA: hypothetical protein DIU15_20095, partial [Deltaproteobacteria bacterium]|nr:hypothetical protein [Deltaproteobacteria bacterium]